MKLNSKIILRLGTLGRAADFALSGSGDAAVLLALLLLPSICASAAERVSLANASVPPPATGAGDSTLAAVSADGRRAAFVSQARDLVAYQGEGATFNVFVRDLETGAIWLASINATGTSGGNGPSTLPTLSSNGQFVAFESSASDLVTNDLNGASDVFVRDLEAGTTVLVSINSSASGSGLGISSNPVMTPDGRYVFFESTALNLVSGDSNGASDVFVRDLMLNTTTLISKRFNLPTSATGGSSHSPMPGADGRIVAFLSTATNLALNTTRTTNNLFFRNLETGVTRMVGIFPPGAANVTVQALNPVLSAGGERLAFRALSSNTNLVPDGVYWCNLVEDTFGRIDPTNVVTTPRVGLGDFSGPVMSADGLIVAYESARAGFAGAARDIQVWNGVTGETTMISFEPSLGNASRNFRPILNAAGTHVAFASNVGSVGSTNAPSDFQLYVHDFSRRTNWLASAGMAGGAASAGDFDWAAPVFSANGGLLAFQSRSDNLVASDRNRALDVFVRDLAASATRLISARATSAPPAEATGLSSLEGGSLSHDGRWLAFFSEAANLVPNDTNGVRDIFVRDLLSGSNILMSVNAEGTATGNGLSQRPSISANGRWVGFVSGASDLVAGDTNRWDDVFLRDLDTGQTILLSVNNDGTGLDSALPHSPAFSSDGRWVVYRDARKIFVWDTQEGTNAPVSVSSDGTQVFAEAGTISPNGRYVAFVAGGLLYVRDRQNATTLPVEASPVFPSAQFSDDNSQLVFQVNRPTNFNLYVHSLATTSNRLVTATASGSPSSNRVPAEARLSANGRFLVFVSDVALAGGLTNTARDIYVRDLGTATTALVSVNYEGKAGGNDRSDSPAISADGRFIVFRSLATNLVGNDTNRQADVFLRDLAAGTTRLVSHSGFGYGSGNQRSARPLINAGGEVILFQSAASDIVVSDFNQVQDLFYFRNLAGTVDSDGDAMDDVWELTHFNTLSRDGQGDFDQDGMRDAEEFRAGTEPTDATSAFVGELIESPQNGVFTLRWNSVPGAVYRVQYRNDLKTSLWTSLAGDVVADGPIAVKGDPTAPFRTQRYYRILLLR